MKIRIALATVFLAITFAGTVSAATTALPPQPTWLPRIYYAIGVCETGLNWKHHTRDYQGAFGFYSGSWDQYKPKGYPADADQATPYQQYRVAKIIHDKFGFSDPWGCYRNGNYRYYM